MRTGIALALASFLACGSETVTGNGGAGGSNDGGGGQSASSSSASGNECFRCAKVFETIWRDKPVCPGESAAAYEALFACGCNSDCKEDCSYFNDALCNGGYVDQICYYDCVTQACSDEVKACEGAN